MASHNLEVVAERRFPANHSANDLPDSSHAGVSERRFPANHSDREQVGPPKQVYPSDDSLPTTARYGRVNTPSQVYPSDDSLPTTASRWP